MNSRSLAVLVACVFASGCTHKTVWCDEHPDDTMCPIKPQCTGDEQCSAPTAVCVEKVDTMVCVECSTANSSACMGAKPVCGMDNACRECEEHAECGSEACLPGGACADEGQVAYVAPAPVGTDNTTCDKAMPCTKLTRALATMRPFVKLSGTTDEEDTVTINNQNVTLIADTGAKLVRSSNGIVLEVKGTSQVTIHDLEISGGSGMQGVGISLPNGNTAKLVLSHTTISGNQGGGISATGGTLTISRSTISGNQGGGISIAGSGSTFHITNNFIVRNGNSNDATFGGASLVGTAQSIFEFNTVADNQTMSGAFFAGGLACSIVGLAAPNNIIVRNRVNGDAMATNANTNGDCTYPTSHVKQTITGLNFKSADDSPYDYHLMTGSVAIDQATTATSIKIDVDGDTRPQGPAPDQGADEFL